MTAPTYDLGKLHGGLRLPAHKRESTTELIKVGLAQTPETINPAELAAWTSVARVILNLHETITRY